MGTYGGFQDRKRLSEDDILIYLNNVINLQCTTIEVGVSQSLLKPSNMLSQKKRITVSPENITLGVLLGLFQAELISSNFVLIARLRSECATIILNTSNEVPGFTNLDWGSFSHRVEVPLLNFKLKTEEKYFVTLKISGFICEVDLPLFLVLLCISGFTVNTTIHPDLKTLLETLWNLVGKNSIHIVKAG